MSVMDVKIFDETPDFLIAIRDLNEEDEGKCASEFRKVVEDSLNVSKLYCNQVDGKNGFVYGAILDRVAFFPLKPAVMQEELVRLGLKESLSHSLAAIWAENAKRVVLARKKVESDLEGVDYEVLVDIGSQEEHVNLHLTHHNGQTAILNFTVEDLFAFYKQIENIQANIDLICK